MAYLEHYGTPRHSGRYPWGSGKNPQRSQDILTRAKELEKQGLSRVEIANAFGMSTTDYRAMYKIASENVKRDAMRRCQELKEKGYSVAAIQRSTGLPWSTVKNYLDPTKQTKIDATTNIANGLKEKLKTQPYLDIGEGVERQLGISDTQLKTAASMLEQQGYNIHTFKVTQPSNPTQKTTIKVLTDGSVDKSEVWKNRAHISSPDGLHFTDYGTVTQSAKPIVSVDSKRIKVNYTDDGSGGGEKDGVIELRPGVEDLSLGNRKYAQVRIAVDGTHYLKGMAVYGTNMPKGIDIVFNTSKHSDVPMMGPKDNTVLKPLKDDPVNPFGSTFTPWSYIDKKGVEHPSPINIVNDDDDWNKWKKSLSSQFLSKQRPELAKKQLDIDYKSRKQELDEIMLLSNPTVKRKLLETYAETADKAAVHLKAAAFPRQASYAILPVPSLKDDEVYAPLYEEGEEVILVRYPHQGTFEIPRLKVVHNNQEGIDIMGTSPAHAIGINAHVANQMSGADYDGDTVLVIPTKGLNLKAGDNIDASSPLYKLRDFNPKEAYPKDPSLPETGSKGEGFNKGKEMGTVSNLITDMTIGGADANEIARAVRHAMVVIDAEKHNLDWRASEKDNGIPQLKEKYQGKAQGGASTLISRATRDYRIDEVKELTSPKLSEDTIKLWNEGKIVFRDKDKVITDLNDIQKLWDAGHKLYRETGRTYSKNKEITNPDDMTDEELERFNAGKRVFRETGKYPKYQTVTDELAWRDPMDISSGSRIELVYANYSANVKDLANKARAELRRTGRLKYNPSAKEAYASEVQSLKDQLNTAALNAPRERQATLIADSNIRAKIQADPSLSSKDNKDKLKKLRAKEMDNARTLVGATRYAIDITPKEWEAIESGAISDTMLEQILRYADIDKVRALATPRQDKGLPANVRARARILLSQGIAPSVVAEELGTSVATLSKEFKNFNDLGDEK